MKKLLLIVAAGLVAAYLATKYFITSVKGSSIRLTFLLNGGARQAMYFPLSGLAAQEKQVGNAMGIKAGIKLDGDNIMLRITTDFNIYGFNINGSWYLRLATVKELSSGSVTREVVTLFGQTLAVRADLVNYEE